MILNASAKVDLMPEMKFLTCSKSSQAIKTVMLCWQKRETAVLRQDKLKQDYCTPTS